MRCIFCKKNSSDSKSVEHIIPESLGGKEYLLGKGLVCDKCNNYFARKVEKPFLEDGTIKLLRFDEGLENKRGKIPPVSAVMNWNHEITLRKDIDNKFTGYIDAPTEAIEAIKNSNRSHIVFPAFTDNLTLPQGSILSRFIGKIAIEAFVFKLVSSSATVELVESFVDDILFDPLRDHVRFVKDVNWPCSVRRIYPAKKYWSDYTTQEIYQIMSEFDFLLIDESECYFVIALFGTEYVINITVPSIEGYENWLKAHKNISPLYWGKNFSAH